MTYGQEKKSKQIKRQQFLHMAAFFWKFSIKKASLLMRLAFCYLDYLAVVNQV